MGGAIHADDLRTTAASSDSVSSQDSIFETCIVPILLYGSETWLLDSTSLNALESFQHEIGCRILRVPRRYSKSAVRIGLHWPSVATRVLIRKLGFLSKLLSGTMDTISRRIFTSLAMENVFETSIVQQCKMLEANLSTCILVKCLSDPQNAPGIVRSNRKHILRSDFQLLLSSSTDRHGSSAAAAQIANLSSWRRLWDTALDQGVKGTRIMQAIFRELCRPTSCFQCSLCEAVVSPSSSCLENMRAYTIPLKWRIFPSITLSLFSQMQTLPFSPRVNVCRTVVVFGPLSTVINHSHSALSVAYCITMCIRPLGHCYIINPRRACAARVTVVVLSVCLCTFYSRTTGSETAYERYQQLQCYKRKKNNVAILLKPLRSGDMARKEAKKPICIMSTGLPQPGLARSAHRGRIKFLRGYVSKSSAAVNRPTHDHAASL